MSYIEDETYRKILEKLLESRKKKTYVQIIEIGILQQLCDSILARNKIFYKDLKK